jgi:Tfp pilus assembly protein FimV
MDLTPLIGLAKLRVAQPLNNNSLEARVESLEKQLKLLQESISAKPESLSGLA